MLSLAKMHGGQERYYVELGREDYYLEGGEPPGRWWGKGAEALGLAGTVQKEELRTLMLGFHPRDGSALGQLQRYRDGRERTPGWDLTFSAVKSASVLWSQAPEDLRGSLQAAHATAVSEALSYLEEAAGTTRRGQGGAEVERAGLVVARFEHGTSRCLDPQLHTHCLVMNAGLREDGSFGALRSRDLFEHKMTAGALYRLAFAQGLRELGFELRGEETWFEVAKVPKGLCESFSKRRQAIEGLLAELGASGPRAAEKLALTSRQVKGHAARAELFRRWQDQGSEFGFGPKEARELQGTSSRQPSLARGTVREAMRELADTDSTFTEKDLVRRVAEKLQAHGVSPREVLEQTRSFLADAKEVISLATAAGRTLYSDPSLYEKEEDLLDHAAKLHARASHGVPDRRRSPLVDSLNDEQRRAHAYLTEPGALKLLSGLAGTGKTHLLNAARDSWERGGLRVLGAALSGRAAHELHQGARIKSSTIESLLYRLEPDLKRQLAHHARMLLREATGRPTWKLPHLSLGKDTVLVIDEASMVGTRHLARLLKAADRVGAKVVLAGDERQLQSIQAGGGFLGLKERFGGAELGEILRQHELWMRDAVRQLATGDVRGALTQYAHAERLHIQPTKEDAARSLLVAWKEGRTDRLSQTLVLAGTNHEVKELNRSIQRMRSESGELGAEFTHRGRTFNEGDRVLFRSASSRLGVMNGDFGTVEVAEPTRFSVLLDRKELTAFGLRDIRVPLRPKDLVVKSFGEERDLLELGYATTVHKAQGTTVDRAFVLMSGPMHGREMAYVQMSRARESVQLFTDEATAGEDLTELHRSMAQSHPKQLAHDAAVNQEQRISR